LLGNQVLVVLTPAAFEHWSQTATRLAQTYRLTQVGAFPLASIGVQCIAFQVPAERSLTEVLQQLAADPRVEAVQPNQSFQGLTTAYNDPYAHLQYGARAVRADLAHQVVTGRGVKVAVVDTGVAVDHPDLQGRILKSENFVEGGEHNFRQDHHGTAVAGVVAADANNAIGIFGIAPEAHLLALKACWQPTADPQRAFCSSWTLAKAIDVAIREGAQVLNLSLTGPADPLLTRLLTRAMERGTTIVAAAMATADHDLGFPASLETVIAVLASDTTGQLPTTATATKRMPVLAAPGMDILTTAPGSTYDFFSGSSLAAAHVSGIAALVLEQHPTLLPAQVYTLLYSTARPVPTAGLASQATIGFVDACAALGKLLDRQLCS
jgi:subtilisin family serine protease